jgi:hypothetical protein
MAENEEETLLTFRGHSAVFEALVTQHRGRVFNRAGDAILAEFDSAVEAVRCATDIQSALRTRNDQLPDERQVRFRIGVNLGDVLLQGDDLLGDGVNVASRLQTAAAPGGICLSGSVYDQIRDKLSLSVKPLGEMSFKNIPHPIRTFSIVGDEHAQALPPPARRAIRMTILAPALLLLITVGGYLGYTQWRRPVPLPTMSPTTATETASAAIGVIADGLYAGPICYGPSPNDPARCFRAQATLQKGSFAGQWKARDHETTVFLTGTVAATGETLIVMRGERDDGTRSFRLELSGRLEHDRLSAAGTFHSGRTATLEWHREN